MNIYFKKIRKVTKYVKNKMDKTILSRWQEKNFKLYALQLYAQGITSPKVTAKIAALQAEIDVERKKHRGDLAQDQRGHEFC